MRMATNEISISSSTITRILGLAAFLLVLANMAGQFSTFVIGHDYVKGLVPLFDLNTERNIPTYYSMLLMLIAALLLAIIAILERQKRAPHMRKWAILSFGFLSMAFDEGFSFHERLILPVRTLLGGDDFGIFYFAWVIPGIVFVVILGLFFLRFLLNLPVTTRVRFMIAAGLYIGGAIGVELVGGRYAEFLREPNWTYSMITTVEESLEMTGLIVFIWALLRYFEYEVKDVRCHFEA